MFKPDLQTLKNVILSKNYHIFGGDGPFHLNIIGIRNNNATQNTFSDTICVFYTDDKGIEHLLCFPGTTVPGRYWLQHPMNVNGTFIMKEGQYKGCWMRGTHTGHMAPYPAMIQVGDLTGYRDADLDAMPDINTPGQHEVTGNNFNVELHHAGFYGNTPSQLNEKWSAGCQVLAAENDLKTIMQLARQSLTYRENLFSYTLLNVKDF